MRIIISSIFRCGSRRKRFGHAVRAVYMYAAMARMAGCCRDEKLLDTCRELWKNITGTQMYITGSIGSTPSGEAFYQGV